MFTNCCEALIRMFFLSAWVCLTCLITLSFSYLYTLRYDTLGLGKDGRPTANTPANPKGVFTTLSTYSVRANKKRSREKKPVSESPVKKTKALSSLPAPKPLPFANLHPKLLLLGVLVSLLDNLFQLVSLQLILLIWPVGCNLWTVVVLGGSGHFLVLW